MKQIFSLALLILFFSCNSSSDVKLMESSIKQSFAEKTGFTPESVQLLKKTDTEYQGLVTLKDQTSATILVTIDADDPDRYMWQVVLPSPTMLQKEIDKLTNPSGEQSDDSKYLDEVIEEHKKYNPNIR